MTSSTSRRVRLCIARLLLCPPLDSTQTTKTDKRKMNKVCKVRSTTDNSFITMMTQVVSRALQRRLLVRQSSSLAPSVFPRPCLEPAYTVRWKRKDGNKAFDRQRPPTRKQRKAYNRKLKAAESSRGAPGSKAGPRREFLQTVKEDLLNPKEDSDADPTSYTQADALLDDLIGNTAQLSSQPTPQPVYLGHKAHKYYNRVADKVAEGATPTDRDISMALRSYRDKQSTRRQPLGLVKSLRFLLQDLSLPITSVGELTFTALLTCCQSPVEGRRVMQLQREQAHEPSSYSWSILTDLHAKVGDFQGCRSVIDEMAQAGHAPTLAAYTSAIAACAQVCQDGGRVPHAIRAQAGEVGWKTWQEMRIVGVTPDVMAFGALLRLCAARGHAERALNVLEEMEQMGVKPTSLCFSSALRAVAKSHGIATRFERGASKRHRRREFLTQHHGKLAIQIVRLAENAEVEQDDAFVSALILCAAAAGDIASSKAIYVASQVRRLDTLRTIGSDEHLARLRGEDDNSIPALSGGTAGLLGQQSSASLVEQHSTGGLVERHHSDKEMSFAEREYGKDSRVLSAVLHASAVAAGPQGLGDMWQGRENRGYLCENSLRLLTARRVPRYENKEIPGQGRTDNLTWSGVNEDQKNYHHDLKSRQKHFHGVHVDEDSAASLDDLEDTFLEMFVDKKGQLREEFRPTTADDIWKLRYGEEEEEFASLSSTEAVHALESSEKPTKMVFNLDERRWETQEYKVGEGPDSSRTEPPPIALRDEDKKDVSEPKEMHFDPVEMRWKAGPASSEKQTKSSGDIALAESVADEQEDDSEMYFDDSEMRWKTRAIASTKQLPRTSFEEDTLAGKQEDLTEDETDFEVFFSELKAEAAENGEGDVSEEEALELFQLMIDEYGETSMMNNEELENVTPPDFHPQRQPSPVMYDVKDKTQIPHGSALDAGVSSVLSRGSTSVSTEARSSKKTVSAGTVQMEDSFWSQVTGDLNMDLGKDLEINVDDEVEVADGDELPSVPDHQLDVLREVLPTFSDKRLERIQRVFQTSLGDPSVLELIPLVRERMPDYITNTWLKQMSSLTSRFVMYKASEDGLVDTHVMNGVLELEAASGSLERAVDFYESFEEHGLSPNGYTDRMMVQMFLKNNRFPRALAFKQKVEGCGRKLDLSSYGSLIDFCSKRDQLGSAMILLKECISVHSAAPSEAFLAQLRISSRRNRMTEELGLTDLIGSDPTHWLRHGEAHLKREYSKKGRRGVQMARNRLVHV